MIESNEILNKLEELSKMISDESSIDYKIMEYAYDSKIFNYDFSLLKNNNIDLSKIAILFFSLSARNQYDNNPNYVKNMVFFSKYYDKNLNQKLEELIFDIFLFKDINNEIIKIFTTSADLLIYFDSETLSKTSFMNNFSSFLARNYNLDLDGYSKQRLNSAVLKVFNYLYQNGNANYRLIKFINNDDIKIEMLIRCVKMNFNNDLAADTISWISDTKKRIEAARRLFYSGYLQPFMLINVIQRNINNESDVDSVINTLKIIASDPNLKSFLDSNVISSIYENNVFDDEFLLKINEKINNTHELKSIMDSNYYFTFLKQIIDVRNRIKITKELFEKGKIDIQVLDRIIRNASLEESIILDYDLMGSIYEKLGNRYLIAKMLRNGKNKKLNFTQEKKFVKLEREYFEKGQIKELLERYKNYGIVDDETFNDIYNEILKTTDRFDLEEVKKRIGLNDNFKQIVEELACEYIHDSKDSIPFENGEMMSSYGYVLKEIGLLFSKCRFSGFPESVIVDKLDLNLCEKFNYRIFKELMELPIFNVNNNTKKALVEIIGMAGLFDIDSEVETRKNKIIELFSILKYPIPASQLSSYTEYLNIDLDKYFDRTTISKYILKEDLAIPEDISGLINKELSENELLLLEKLSGNVGSSVNKFLHPYAKNGNEWVIKNGLSIEQFEGYLKPVMSDEEYNEVLNSINTPEEVIKFLNPYKEVKQDAYIIKESYNSKEEFERAIEFVLHFDIDNNYNADSLHRIFDGMPLEYDPEFFEFFINNQELILSDKNNQKNIKEIRKEFQAIKEYFQIRGNINPTYYDFISLIVNDGFSTEFGNEEFAKEAKPNRMTNEAYKHYEELLKKTRKRFLTTVPRHNKEYEYVDKDGVHHRLMAKMLRSDDPFNLLVGEARYTNCCQRYGGEGESCMVHASTSQDGGIFAIYLLDNGYPQLMTQSWVWSNEGKICLDNVEATDLIKNSGIHCDEYRAMARFVIRQSAKDLIKNAQVSMDKFIESRTKYINGSNMSDDEKKKELGKLEEIRRRQTLRQVTVGTGCDDIDIKSEFTEVVPINESYGPKGYFGYRDSKGDANHKQYVVEKTAELLQPDLEYKDTPIYRDERRTKVEIGNNITYETLRKITDIETFAHKEEMIMYVSKHGFYTIREPRMLADMYGCDVEDLRVISGEDWYYVYSDNGKKIEVYDFAKSLPRLDDEGMNQQSEMLKGFEKILFDSIIRDENNNMVGIKPIKASLREDTSYMLYLIEKKRGIISQVGNDIAHPYSDISNTNIISEETQNKILSNMKTIRENKKLESIMHDVTFIPTQKEIQKLLTENNNEKGMVM